MGTHHIPNDRKREIENEEKIDIQTYRAGLPDNTHTSTPHTQTQTHKHTHAHTHTPHTPHTQTHTHTQTHKQAHTSHTTQTHRHTNPHTIYTSPCSCHVCAMAGHMA